MTSTINRLTSSITTARDRIFHPRPLSLEGTPAPGVRPAKGSKLRVIYGVCYALSTRIPFNRRLLRLLALVALFIAPPVTVTTYLLLAVLLPFERPSRT
jgi:phage shock protein PspC (stress-responsive transcriptional regulator)